MIEVFGEEVMTTEEILGGVGTTDIPEGQDFPDDFFDDLPEPLFWRILVMPKIPEEITQGGLLIPAMVQDAQKHGAYIGQVMKCGPLVGKRPPLNGADLHLEPGDWVAYGKYAGQVITYKGERLLVINDEDLLLWGFDPEHIKIYI